MRGRFFFRAAAALGLAATLTLPALADEAAVERAASALAAAYPEFVAGRDGNWLALRDGRKLALDDGRAEKSFEQWLDDPDIKDTFRQHYPLGRTGTPPGQDYDPGRARNAALLDAMYGNCLADPKAVRANLVPVKWLPRHNGGTLLFSRANGAATALQKVSDELDQLPDRYLPYLKPSAGTVNCRPIAGTRRLSAHGYGIAIDIATRHSHYWQWAKAGAGKGSIPWRNEIPREIVEVFERHGFIWGGKWYHYDTMHFEYRPELIATGQ